MTTLFLLHSETGNLARRSRLPTEPGPETMGLVSPVFTSPVKSPPFSSLSNNDSDDSSYKCKNVAKLTFACLTWSLQCCSNPIASTQIAANASYQGGHGASNRAYFYKKIQTERGLWHVRIADIWESV